MDGSRQRGGPPSFDWGVVVLAVRQTPPAGAAAAKRRAGEPDPWPLEELETEAILGRLRGCSSVG